MHLLVIDDDQDFSHLLGAHLTRPGHDVSVADDGIQTQRMVRGRGHTLLFPGDRP